ncbi:helix-turn-helix domain-containing protein [Spongiactinospora sp. TRM90649]|uniref:helix-turn-helix domain-containing protein n=1 Tax=Spongiactinospora sp. TRM90649 TaxID=3031114 RepID=UPI0023F8F013|nr:helix-turn-helix domain-containing protein [Spongiactinospora sp. TRM90649]MDF5755246.1 helix-turn-helix domain-containing protein [Spongiactinospora sp. TRM90649]
MRVDSYSKRRQGESLLHAGGPRISSELGQYLRRLRLHAGLTQEELSERSGVSVRTIGNIECDRIAQPRTTSIRALAEALGLSSGRLIQGGAVVTRTASPPIPDPWRVTPPFHIPYDALDFTGRQAAIADVRSIYRDRASANRGDASPLVVTGAAGSGKTSFATHVAHRMRSDHPDGSVLLPLRGPGEGPLDSTEALARLVLLLGGPRLPDRFEAQLDWYRSTTVNRRMMIIFDDAQDENQILPLLPDLRSCTVIVTGRRRLAGLAGSKRLELEPFSGEESLELLRRILGADRVGAEPVPAYELTTLCHGLPLALRLVGTKLASRPHWKLADMVARLSDEARVLDEISYKNRELRRLLAGAIRRVDPIAQRILRRLGRSRESRWTAGRAAAILGMTLDETMELLECLVEERLLVAAPPSHRGEIVYEFPNLLGVYARELAETPFL